MLKDRGTIKWTSLMLPEHVEMLQELWQEDEIISPPDIDEQLLDELNTQIKSALLENKKVRLRAHVNGRKQIYIGKIKRVCKSTQSLILTLDDGTDHTLQVSLITHIQLIKNY